MGEMKFETLAIHESAGVARIELARPGKANAFDAAMWKELRQAFEWLDAGKARVGVLSGQGKHFCAGIDLEFLAGSKARVFALPEGRRSEGLRRWIVELQEAVGAAEACSKPVLAAIHGACVGAGVDVATACDMRYATEDARFSVKEVDLAIVADVGTLQRLPRLVGEGVARELAFTGRDFDGREAHALGLVNRVFPDADALMRHVLELAAAIARKSPATVRGIKATMNYSRDHSVAEGLAHIASRNAASLFSRDLDEAIAARMQKREPVFDD
jgi:enoyl-CoA hydratase